MRNSSLKKSFFLPVSLIMLTLAVAVFAAHSTGAAVWQDKVDPWVIQRAERGSTEFIIFLTEQADLSGSALLATKQEKGKWVFDRLTAVAQQTQKSVIDTLKSLGVEYRPFWVANMIWVRGSMDTVTRMALRSDVARVHANPAVRMQMPAPEPVIAQPFSTTAVESNISHVNAPAVWTAGYTGQGVVIAGQDTGYQWDHPALINQYRGWSGSTASHDYNWHDAIHSGGGVCGADSPFPCDDDGHGTHTMGIMVGDDGGANQIGMAPGARWIGCRNMDQGGVGTPITYAECYQWLIAPTRVDGSAPNPAMAPDVVSNSWGCPQSEGCTDPNVLLTVVNNVRAAGIMTVQSAGNSGPACSTVNEPAAIYQSSFTVGAANNLDVIASFSSRGPVTVDGSGRLKPDIVAPGVSVTSCVPIDTYSIKSGTSMAAPHVAGLAALIVSANPYLANQVSNLESIIRQTAVPLTTAQGCGGDGPNDVPNNVYGWGRIDALAAYNASQATGSLMVTIAPQEAIDAGAQWRVDQGVWQNSGQTVSNLLIGQHQLEFKAAPPWNTPPGQSAIISALQTTAINVSYSQAKAFPYLYLLLLD